MIITAIDYEQKDWFAVKHGMVIYHFDVTTFVHRVLASAADGQILRLNVVSHSGRRVLTPGEKEPELGELGIYFGNEFVSVDNVTSYAKALGLLKPKFHPTSGYVCLYNCSAGKQKRLMMYLSQTIGVPVMANTASTWHYKGSDLKSRSGTYGHWLKCASDGCQGTLYSLLPDPLPEFIRMVGDAVTEKYLEATKSE